MISLGEGFTPLVHAHCLGDRMGLANLYLKDESLNPTGSVKARGMAVAVSKAHELGIRKVSLASDGNGAAALAAYAAKAGMEASIFIPEGTAAVHRQECALFGAHVTLVPGNVTDCARVLRESLPTGEWFNVSAWCESYRLEGMKTLAYEVCEQMGGRLPDAMIYPTGECAGLIGMWKAFDEMQEIGWIKERLPRMFAIQSHGCAPLVRAYGESAESAAEWANPRTIASSLCVPATNGDSLVLRAVRKSRGAALAVSDAAMLGGMRLIAETEGIITSPEGGATLAGLERMLADGFLGGHETIVLFLTGSGYKHADALERLVEDEKN
jgi:threonine synthase